MNDPITPGFRFKEGKLYIFEPTGIMVLHAWPELRAVRKAVRGSEWKPFAPLFRVVVPYRRSSHSAKSSQQNLDLGALDSKTPLRELRKRAFDSFRFAMPKPAAARVERFQNMQWRVLLLFQAERRALEVCRSNPALVFCLANARSILGRPVTVNDVARFILRRQRDLMHCLGLAPTESNAKTLAKVVPESISAQSMRALVTLLTTEATQRALTHLRKINNGVIALLSDPHVRVACSPTLLEEISMSRQENYRGWTARQLADIQRMADWLGEPLGDKRYASQRVVEADHARLSLEFSQRGMLQATGIRFCRPPIPGTAQIVPLRTPADLAEEGRQQGNCVGSYVDHVQQGHLYIYRVLEPERATLSLARDECGHWEIDQLLASHNRRVQPETMATVSEWIDQYSVRP